MTPAEQPLVTIRVSKLDAEGQRVEVSNQQVSEDDGSNYAPRYESWPACSCPVHREAAE